MISESDRAKGHHRQHQYLESFSGGFLRGSLTMQGKLARRSYYHCNRSPTSAWSCGLPGPGDMTTLSTWAPATSSCSSAHKISRFPTTSGATAPPTRPDRLQALRGVRKFRDRNSAANKPSVKQAGTSCYTSMGTAQVLLAQEQRPC